MYTVFCDVVLSVIVGKIYWKKFQTKRVVTMMATRSDEAFGLLLLENYIEIWATVAWADVRKEEIQEMPKAKYTLQKSGGGEDNGWLDKGIKRYNKLLDEVKTDRMNQGAERGASSFDLDYMAEKRREDAEASRKRKGRPDDEEPKDTVLVQDAWD